MVCGWYAAAMPFPPLAAVPLVLAVALLWLPAQGGAGALFMVDGAGWGHGVGMSRWGALGSPSAGWGHERILEHSTPGRSCAVVPAGRVHAARGTSRRGGNRLVEAVPG